MSGRQLYTESDVRAMPRGSELALGPSAIATPAALDVAFARDIRVVFSEGSAASSSAAASSGLSRLLASEGTYVVQVRAGRGVVTRLGPGGPEAFGDLP